jgi:FkbM family methyltransferase
MNPFPGPYFARSGLRAMFVPMLRHWWWLRSPEYRAWLRFNRQLRREPRRHPGTVTYRDQRIAYVDAASFLSAWHEIFVMGSYEVQPPTGDGTPLLIDAGANIGLAALFWKIRFAAFRYIGFEPDPAVAATCRANFAAWQCDGTLHEAAVAGRVGRQRFGRDYADGGALVAGKVAAETIEVATVRLADFLAEPVDLLKIDIEGAEDEVMVDIEPRLGCVRNLFVEIHSIRGEPQRWGSLVERLQRAGFRCYVRPLLPPWRPFVEPSPGGLAYDEQFNVFAVRPEAPRGSSS